MSFRIPNGSTFDLASTYGSAITITAISNANPAVVTATAHGLADGDIIELTSGWTGVNGRLFRVDGSTTNSFELEGVDTTDTSLFAAGGGAGSCREITAFVGVTQVTDVSSNGGEQQFFTFGFLEEFDDRQIPTTRSPYSLTIPVADDPAQPFIPVAEAADKRRNPVGVRLNIPGGAKILYNGYLTISETPTLTRNNLMIRTMTFSLAGRPTRYNA
ncbi:phage tail protein [Pseudomonas tohonis]|uniref:phage tail protein n=1 Tax=Pseudomonas tohonis TaxID=2725477 RepID=UPI001F26228D|nr:phage tail protein [Pseudomonas tohonis]